MTSYFLKKIVHCKFSSTDDAEMRMVITNILIFLQNGVHHDQDEDNRIGNGKEDDTSS